MEKGWSWWSIRGPVRRPHSSYPPKICQKACLGPVLPSPLPHTRLLQLIEATSDQSELLDLHAWADHSAHLTCHSLLLAISCHTQPHGNTPLSFTFTNPGHSRGPWEMLCIQLPKHSSLKPSFLKGKVSLHWSFLKEWMWIPLLFVFVILIGERRSLPTQVMVLYSNRQIKRDDFKTFILKKWPWNLVLHR